MTLRVALLATLLVTGLALAGCSGGGDDPSGTTTTSTSVTPSTSQSTNSTSPVRTVTSITTVSGTPTTVTKTVTTTQTGTSTQVGPMPVIDNVTITPGVNSARIDYDVYGGTGSLVSGAEYDLASLQTYSSTSATVNGAGTQRITLTGLASCTSYKVRLYVRDASSTVVRTGDNLFQTLEGAAANVTSLAVDQDSVTDVSMKVKWTVTGPTDVKSKVVYGISTLDKVSAEQTGIGAKEVVLTQLTGGQTYKYQVVVSGPCGTLTLPSTPLQQKTATVKVVTINQNAAVSGATNAFSPGSSLSGDLQVKKGERYVFEVVNADSGASGAVTHEFHLETAAGASLGYSSGNIGATAPNNKYHFPVSVAFDTIGTASYKMRCIHHSTMVGDITVTA